MLRGPLSFWVTYSALEATSKGSFLSGLLSFTVGFLKLEEPKFEAFDYLSWLAPWLNPNSYD
jgi:hypothetical protein